ncbi:transglycosylase SLT domain-containing protein [uncultured Veillonella sp.]|uniref:lytic transglycosylase domain-containing protein n=1 Tax=uncultured Veillonella sp. TaxID=159268 RepID=UPI0026129376|nr:transglycosylase SLT domain-containing protein [uncultured Veillonella sp.]
MKFVNYDPAQKLNTIQGGTQASGNEMAYGGNQQGLSNLGKAIGDLGSTMLQIQKQKELVDVVNAANEYTEAMNQAMYDPENGLMNRKGENALNIPTDYSEIESVKRNGILRKYHFKMTDSINAFNKIVDNDRINTINTINRYVRGQYEDSAMKALNMSIQNIANNGVVNSNPDSFGQTMQQISGSVHVQLANLGYDDNTINLQVKKAQQDTAVTMIEKKISDDDLDGANKMINAAAESGLIDEKEIMGYRQKVRNASMVLATSDDSKIDSIIGEFDPNDPDLLAKVTDKLFSSGFGKVAGASASNATVQDVMNAVMGQESGGNASAVNGRTGAYGLFQIMPDNWPEWSKEAGLAGADMSDPEAQKKVAAFKLGQYVQRYGVEGALVAWYAGEANGERWRDGAPDAIDGNGGHYSWDAPQGNGDEPSVRQYMQETKARLLGDGKAQEETPAEAQKRKDMIRRNVATRLEVMAKRKAQILENQKVEIEQRVAAAVKNGATDVEVLKMRQDYAETHSEYQRAMQGQLNQAQISANKAAAKALQAKEANVLAVKTAISNGQFKSMDDLNNFMGQMGVYFTPPQLAQINHEFDEYSNGTGKYSPEMSGMKSSIENLAGRKIDGVEWQGVSTAVYPKVQEFRKQHGYDPSPAQLAQWGADAVAEQTIASTETGKYWGVGKRANFFGGRGAALSYTDAQLASQGMYGLYNTTGADGQPYYVYKDARGEEYTITPEQLAERLGQ